MPLESHESSFFFFLRLLSHKSLALEAKQMSPLKRQHLNDPASDEEEATRYDLLTTTTKHAKGKLQTSGMFSVVRKTLFLLVICSVFFWTMLFVQEYQKAAIECRINSDNQEPVILLSRQYATVEEQQARSKRFPSVEERVKIYAGNWYTPPCPGNTQALVTYERSLDRGLVVLHELERPGKTRRTRSILAYPKVEMSRTFVYDKEHMLTSKNPYALDILQYMSPALARLNVSTTAPPILLMFSDESSTRAYAKGRALLGNPNLPLIRKFRPSFGATTSRAKRDDEDSQNCVQGLRPLAPTADVVTGRFYEAMIWRVTSNRHYGMLPDIPPADIAWEKKRNMAVFRGGLTGKKRDGFSKELRLNMTDTEMCLVMHRCRLVYQTANSKLVDAKLVPPVHDVPESIGNVQIFDKPIPYVESLKYKAIIMLEGNDVSSGLKWALYSNSVVLTQVPTKTSWAMEEWLEPWVHYIPINKELSDVDEKMQWVLDHDEKAKEIAHRGSLWIKDLLLHPDAARDDELIYDDLLRRYMSHFAVNQY